MIDGLLNLRESYAGDGMVDIGVGFGEGEGDRK